MNNQEMIGKYVSRKLYSDIQIVGKVIGIYGKTGIIIEKINAVRDTVKKEYVVGGFSAYCLNNETQKWEFESTNIILKHRIGRSWNRQYMLCDSPIHHYDYNF